MENKSSFVLHAPFQATGDQPQAIARLIANVEAGAQYQTLLGATGTGKTFSIASTIEKVGKPSSLIDAVFSI